MVDCVVIKPLFDMKHNIINHHKLVSAVFIVG